MLIYCGDPFLRVRAKEVVGEDPLPIINKIISAMETYNAVGLSACHVGVPLRIIVMGLPDQPRRVFINPKLSEPSKEKTIGEEGSISFPGIRVSIERPNEITVTAQDERGVLFTERFSGLAARVIMHENDQLNGVIFIDRASKKERNRVKDDLARLSKRAL